MQCTPILSAAAVQRQRSVVVVTAAESVNLVGISENSFHRCFWLFRQQATARLSPPRSEIQRAEGPILGSYSFVNLCTNWTRFTLKQIRAALFLGASLAISILPYRSLSAHSSHSGRRERKMRGRRGDWNRQWVEWGSSSVSFEQREVGGYDTSRMKVNGTEDLQDDAYGVETKAEGGNLEERVRNVGDIIKGNSNRVRHRRWQRMKRSMNLTMKKSSVR